MPFLRFNLRYNPPVFGRVVRDCHGGNFIADPDREIREDAGASWGGFEECILRSGGIEGEAGEGAVTDTGDYVRIDRGGGTGDRDVEAFVGQAEFSS